MNTKTFKMIKSEKLHSFKLILFAAIIVRLIAAIFSQGYGMHDDHFLVIEASASWVDGYDYNNWLPWTEGNSGVPEGHSFTYVGLNYIYFACMKFLGVIDPKILMLVNRLIHGFASLIVVWFGMKITENLSNRENAVKVGWILALLWIMPFVSVRNLVEVAALPFLVYGFWLLLKKENFLTFLFSGLMIGMAVSFRYQIGVFAIGIAAYYFFKWHFKLFFGFSIGVLIAFCLTQGVVDYFIWGYPFTELASYITYNLKEGKAYMPNQNYFMYFLVLMGSLFVPLGLLLGIGFFKSYKKYAVLFIPTLFFILFHTLYPNRQERFILSVLPFFIILGVMGFQLLKASNWKNNLWKTSIVIFWVFNIPFLFFASTMYSKKSRVEAMYTLYGNKMEEERILLEGSSSQRVSMLPKFYAKSWHCSFTERTDTLQDLHVNPELDFDYIFFFDEMNLTNRIQEYKEIYPNMMLTKKCNPSLIDVLLRELNPRNANEYIEVWKTNSFIDSDSL
jgi:hypothetical protein